MQGNIELDTNQDEKKCFKSPLNHQNLSVDF